MNTQCTTSWFEKGAQFEVFSSAAANLSIAAANGWPETTGCVRARRPRKTCASCNDPAIDDHDA
jgi:hypothetical protein